MLDNYVRLENGVIKQIVVEQFKYGYEYSNAYNNVGVLGKYMSYLRLGNLIGSIGYVPKSILDVGYGNGDFLSVAKNIIPECYGYDVTKDYPIPDGCNFVDNIYDKHYDIITMFDVLEHYNDIYDIKKIKCNYIYVSMPWCNYKSDEWFKNWKHRKLNEHIWHFDNVSLKNFFNEIGYECINITEIEDCIRNNSENSPNILSGIFKKKPSKIS